MIWHSEEIENIVRELDTDPYSGLSEEQACTRLNQINREKPAKKRVRFFFHRCRIRLYNPFLLLLVLALLIYLTLTVIQTIQGTAADLSSVSLLTLPLLAMNVLLLLTGAALDTWAWTFLTRREESSPACAQVVRGGELLLLTADQVAPGDILLLKAGDLIPADCRLLEGEALFCDESSLTGEVFPVEKQAGQGLDAITPLAGRRNMLYAGGILLRGSGRAIAVETGENTERVRLASLSSQGDAVPYRDRLKKWDRAGRWGILVMAVLTFFAGLAFSVEPLDLLFTILAGAAAISSAGLPLLSLLFLARGVRRMDQAGITIRRLSAVTDLDQVTVIGTDKSGILTENGLTVSRLYAGGQLVKADRERTLPESSVALLRLALLCGGDKDNAADAALLACGTRNGLDKAVVDQEHPRLAALPFQAHRKRMATVNLIEGRPVVIVKGSPEAVFPLCTASDTRAAVLTAEEMGKQALHVLAVGYRFLEEAPTDLSGGEWETDLTLAGIIGMTDAPRRGTPEAIRLCRRAGIRVAMFTGNPKAAAQAAGQRLGILSSPEETAVSGDELETAAAENGRVFSRLVPEEKQQLMELWKQQGETVAVTGILPSDAALLRKADVGCSPAFSADAARDSADMVWQDGRFATLTAAIRESRGIADNLRRGTGYLFSCGAGLLLSLFLGVLLFGVFPFQPFSLSWAGLAAVLFLGALFAGRQADNTVMTAHPRRFPGGQAFLGAVCILLAVLLSYGTGRAAGTETARAMALATLILTFLTTALTQRSAALLFRSFRHRDAAVLGLALLLTVLPGLLPPIRLLAGMSPLSRPEGAAAAAWALLPLAGGEAGKGTARLLGKLPGSRKRS